MASRPRPFRFGIQAAGTTNRSSWVELARRVEAHGYSVLTMPDHFTDQLAPVPALMAAADATTDLRIGALVWDNDYKHPVVLAKELATLDLLSDGRLEIGIGAGWMRSDYDQSGIAYDPPAVRVDRFVEGLAVIKGLMGPGPFSFEGTHYRISGLDGRPKPVQSPRPPVLIGAGGRRMLAIAAREADIVGINGTLTSGAVDAETLRSMSAEATGEKVAWLREVAGPRFDELELNVRAFFVAVTADVQTTVEGIAGMIGFSPEEVLASPFALVGDPERMVEVLLERRERYGFSYVIVGSDEADAFAPVVARLAGR